MYNQCDYETGDTINGVPFLCDNPASVKIRGIGTAKSMPTGWSG